LLLERGECMFAISNESLGLHRGVSGFDEVVFLHLLNLA
jgi:hypothetical protein